MPKTLTCGRNTAKIRGCVGVMVAGPGAAPIFSARPYVCLETAVSQNRVHTPAAQVTTVQSACTNVLRSDTMFLETWQGPLNLHSLNSVPILLARDLLLTLVFPAL